MISGVGVHSGEVCRVRFHRADGPLRFRSGRTEIPALVDNVVSTERCVTLEHNGVRVSTVEHLLAACHAAGIWSGLAIEVDGPELPILDGSARPWYEELTALGPTPDAPPPLAPAASLEMPGGNARIEPGPFGLDVTVDYPHPAIGRQRWAGDCSSLHELLDARTFGFLSELEYLRRAGLASGAGPENAIVFDEERPLWPLRREDEPVRHKALDLLGDLALLGRPIEAHIVVEKGSHRLHVDMLRQLLLNTTLEEART